MTRPTNRERVVIDNALRSIYENGQRLRASTLPIGTLILDKSVDDHCEEGEAIYQVFVIFRVGADTVRCAHYNSDLIPQTDYQIEPDAMVVVLGIAPQPKGKEFDDAAKRDYKEALRLSVQTRTSNLVLFGPEGQTLVLSGVRHNKDGQPTSGEVINGGWKLSIRNGVGYSGHGKKSIYDFSAFEVLYVPKNVVEAATQRTEYLDYERVLSWAKKIPKKYRIVFKAGAS